MNVTLKLIGLLAILLVGVVLGLQTAERGIYKVDGLPEQKPQSFYITKVDKGEMEIAVMGKQVKANPKQMINYVSEFGLTAGQFVKDGTKKAIDWVAGFLQP